MIAHVKAKYANGVLAPLEPLDLKEGAGVTVPVECGPADGVGGGVGAEAGVGRDCGNG